VPAARQPLPQGDPVAAGDVEAVGDRVAERHDAHAAVRLGDSGFGDPDTEPQCHDDAEQGGAEPPYSPAQDRSPHR
jgi:hypothetical protein